MSSAYVLIGWRMSHNWLNQSQSYFTTGGLPPISSLWRQAPWDSRPVILFSKSTIAVIVLMYYPLWGEDGYVVYNLLLALASAVILMTESSGTTAFYCLRFEIHPNWKARSPYLYPPWTWWPGYVPRRGFPFRGIQRLAELRRRYSTPPPHGTIDLTQPTKI
jgi:hypothetical protein